MKKNKIFGILLVVLAFIVLFTGVLTNQSKDGDGAFANALNSARETMTQVSDNGKAVKNAASTEKKATTAQKKIADAAQDTAQALEDIAALDAAFAAGEPVEADVDALRAALEQLKAGSETAAAALQDVDLSELESGISGIEMLTEEKILALYHAVVDEAYKSVSEAESAIDGVREGCIKVSSLAAVAIEEADSVEMTELPVCASIEECRSALTVLDERARALDTYTQSVADWAAEATVVAAQASELRVSFKDKFVVMLADNFIGVLFTFALLMVIALVMIFLAESFKRQWTKNPVFSVGMALIVMLVFQTYALGFNHGSIGQWAKFWFDNTFNVLRANTSVGIIALGMTLVIIIGGIDLAVGSTLAGVGTVLMVMIDTGEYGVLANLGITGVPAFIIGIVVALAAGVGIGAGIGLLVTKGRIPPFIVTLGVMNVVRSVAQYFTKSYNPTLPKEFEAIANTVILGQRPMTIIYWLVLAVIFYLMMKHTAFGRHVYAVGSNERTTRLSGINTDKVKMKVYMISGLVVAIASVAQLSRLGGMDVASAGNGYELDAIAAVVVGGTAMSGGRGSIVGTVLGVLIIGIMNNLLILLGVDSFLTDAFKGAIVIAAVLMQRKESSN